MKTFLCIIVLFAAFPFAISAGKGGKPLTSGPTLNISPAVYVPEQPISFSGSGYKASKPVRIDLEGPTPQTIYGMVDGNGDFDLSYGGFSYAPGYYTVSSYQAVGKLWSLMTTAGFEVE